MESNSRLSTPPPSSPAAPASASSSATSSFSFGLDVRDALRYYLLEKYSLHGKRKLSEAGWTSIFTKAMVRFMQKCPAKAVSINAVLAYFGDDPQGEDFIENLIEATIHTVRCNVPVARSCVYVGVGDTLKSLSLSLYVVCVCVGVCKTFIVH